MAITTPAVIPMMTRMTEQLNHPKGGVTVKRFPLNGIYEGALDFKLESLK